MSAPIGKHLLFVVAAAALIATPAATQTLPYGGIGAIISSFQARNSHGGGTPPVSQPAEASQFSQTRWRFDEQDAQGPSGR